MSSGQVRARFVTNHDDYRISDAPFAIPAKLGRRGLSEVINHLLGNEGDDQQRPFDFSIQDILVRTPLSVFLAQQQMSAEAVIEIEYMPAMALSDEKDSIDTPAWVGCMHYHDHGSSKSLVAGCYDGGIEIINPTTRATASKHQCHADPIRDVFRWTVDGSSTSASTSSILATGSKDQTVRLWAMGGDALGGAQEGNKKTKSNKREAASSSSGAAGPGLTALAVCKGHIQSVESLTLLESNGTKVLLSGDWAGNIMGWNVQRAGDEDFQDSNHAMDVEVSADGSNKKRKTAKGSANSSAAAAPLKTLSSIFTFKAHSQSISAMHTLPGTSTTFTCSWDHSIKQWDMERQDVVAVFTSGSKISTSLNANAKSGLVATSHSDGKVRLWDTRTGNTADSSASSCQSITNSTRAGVPQWVSDVQWHPTQTTAFACTDYGGVVCVWDIRSTKVALSEKETHDGKALCAQWTDDAVFTGGSDCAVHATNFQ